MTKNPEYRPGHLNTQSVTDFTPEQRAEQVELHKKYFLVGLGGETLALLLAILQQPFPAALSGIMATTWLSCLALDGGWLRLLRTASHQHPLSK